MGNSTIYKVLKQGYPATYNFKDDADGAFPSGWTDVDGTDCETTVIASLDGHKKVLQLYDQNAGDDCNIWIVITQGLNTTIEFFVTKDSVGANTSTYLYMDEAPTSILILRWEDNDLDYFDGAWKSAKDNFLVANTFSHIKLVLDDTANTFDIYIDGILEKADAAYRNNSTSGINHISFRTDSADTGYKGFFDAIGISTDTNYNVGDNIHWRHYKDQDSDFESEDVGTVGTSISFVDTDISGGVGTVTIVPSFDEHKKRLEIYHGALAADDAGCENNFASAQINGTIEFWIETTDASYVYNIICYSGGVQKMAFRIVVDTFQWHDGAWQTLATTPLDNTKYHIRIDFECGAGLYKGLAADTAIIYINNISQGIYDLSAVTDNLDKIEFSNTFTAVSYVYIDAVSYSWTSGNRIGDNRILEYYSLNKTDITNKCSKCTITKAVTIYSTASIETTETFGDEHYLQIIDENSDLRFIGNRFKDIDIGISVNGYSFQDLNKVELEKEDSYTASSAEDVNASLLGILTNVGQADGRLIYYTEDDPAGNLTPNYRNKPRHMITRILAIRGGKKCIIKASGKVFLDDDANPDNGAATITGASSELMGIPLIDRSSHQINYVEVRGGIDPGTGTPFSGISQDASAQADGTGIIPYYKRLRELQSDIDCQNVAIAIRTGTNFTPQILRIRLRGIYADPGEIINFAYSNKSFTATNCYVDSVRMNVLNNVCNYSLNTGISDPITFNSPGYTYADETADDIGETLYTTDMVVPPLHLVPFGCTIDGLGGILCDADGEGVEANFWVDSKCDASRDMVITFVWQRGDANNDVITAEYSLHCTKTDGSEATNYLTGNGTPFDATTMNACAENKWEKWQLTVSNSDFDAGDHIGVRLLLDEASRTVRFFSGQTKYYIKRSV